MMATVGSMSLCVAQAGLEILFLTLLLSKAEIRHVHHHSWLQRNTTLKVIILLILLSWVACYFCCYHFETLSHVDKAGLKLTM